MNGYSTSGMIECAKEELEMLELQHPNRFEYLKMELKDFISDFQSSNLDISVCPSVHTQESSNRKRKKDSPDEVEESTCRPGGNGLLKKKKKRSKTEAILNRARKCLLKIQQFKTSF